MAEAIFFTVNNKSRVTHFGASKGSHSSLHCLFLGLSTGFIWRCESLTRLHSSAFHFRALCQNHSFPPPPPAKLLKKKTVLRPVQPYSLKAGRVCLPFPLGRINLLLFYSQCFMIPNKGYNGAIES